MNPEPLGNKEDQMQNHEPETPIENAINIGAVLAGRLKSVGVQSLEKLKEVGDSQVYTMLAARYPESCYHERLALAGAVRDVRWHHLPKEVKEAVKTEVE